MRVHQQANFYTQIGRLFFAYAESARGGPARWWSRVATKGIHVPVLTMAIALLGAGCFSSDSIGSGQDAACPSCDEFSQGPAFRGRVLTADLFPIADAEIIVDGSHRTWSDASGDFAVRGLDSGTHELLVEAAGYTSLAQTFVWDPDGSSPPLTIRLEEAMTNAAYVTVLMFRGYDICSLSAGIFSLPQPCPFGERSSAFPIEVGNAWAYGVFEMRWATSESFLFSSTHGPTLCNRNEPCWGVVVGRSPLRLEAAPDDADIAARYAFDGQKRYPTDAFRMYVDSTNVGLLREELNNTAYAQCGAAFSGVGAPPRLGCPFGVGFSLGTTFEYFASYFYQERPEHPEAYSAMPDA